MAGIDESGKRVEPNSLNKIMNKVRPDDFGEPDTYIKYLNNRVFKKLHLQALSELKHQKYEENLTEAKKVLQ